MSTTTHPTHPAVGACPGPAGGRCEPTGLVFLLGTHQPGWLRRLPVPLFISDRRLRHYRRLPAAAAPWALDSGGFTELATHGTWDHGPTPLVYARRVRRYRDHIGHLHWAAPQDWMCEPFITAKTGLPVREHQARTVGNLLDLRALAPDLPWAPIVQGWTTADYLHCLTLYARAGIDLSTEPLIGVGSVCRRQATAAVGQILTALRAAGLTRLHGFGVKTTGVLRYGHLLTSADSLAWSYAARRDPPLPGCRGRHRNCANCPHYATTWRHRLLARLAATTTQPSLWEQETAA